MATGYVVTVPTVLSLVLMNMSKQVETQHLVSRKPLIDYSGVNKAIQDKFGTGAPKFYDDFSGKPVALTRAEAVSNPRLV